MMVMRVVAFKAKAKAHFQGILLEHSFTGYLSLWHSGSVRDSESVDPVSSPQHSSHCVIEAGGMCKLTVALTSGWLVH